LLKYCQRNLNPVPIGVPGELHVGGPVLARGYLNRPELTKARFIPDPFTEEPGARVYKTGDLARYLADGNIEFLGRVDEQVKIRGFRVEPGEVEAALSGYPAVHQAVVVVKKDANGSERLVAYVVVSREHTPSVRELRGYLKEKLPEYMVPSAFVTLDGLPLMPNGKVDRKALPAPEVLRPELLGDFVAPRDALEEQLVSIWEEVLGVERVGIHDDFFELGGHSLLATQVISRVRDAFGVELPLRSLFEEPTVAGWSVAVTQRQAEEADPQRMERILAELEDPSGEEHL
jgi:acyl carrier protein